MKTRQRLAWPEERILEQGVNRGMLLVKGYRNFKGNIAIPFSMAGKQVNIETKVKLIVVTMLCQVPCKLYSNVCVDVDLDSPTRVSLRAKPPLLFPAFASRSERLLKGQFSPNFLGLPLIHSGPMDETCQYPFLPTQM